MLQQLPAFIQNDFELSFCYTGADINSSTSLVGSVLHMACSEKISNRLEVMQLLLSRGADPNIIVAGLDGSPMLPPLGDYLASCDEHDQSVINLLLRYGAEVSWAMNFPSIAFAPDIINKIIMALK